MINYLRNLWRNFCFGISVNLWQRAYLFTSSSHSGLLTVPWNLEGSSCLRTFSPCSLSLNTHMVHPLTSFKSSHITFLGVPSLTPSILSTFPALFFSRALVSLSNMTNILLIYCSKYSINMCCLQLVNKKEGTVRMPATSVLLEWI